MKMGRQPRLEREGERLDVRHKPRTREMLIERVVADQALAREMQPSLLGRIGEYVSVDRSQEFEEAVACGNVNRRQSESSDRDRTKKLQSVIIIFQSHRRCSDRRMKQAVGELAAEKARVELFREQESINKLGDGWKEKHRAECALPNLNNSADQTRGRRY
ncbi:unnamed protein product [Mycena citricolor]|uniref:Uncharacterized protein n=1 Tax=Mycena citricolor TaxID=2018698 RepID=A0AAD2HGP3_9AGAR|nr:unnamed protein product [Mycena citricolor]